MSHSLAYYVYTTTTEDEEDEEHDMMMNYNTSIVSQLNIIYNHDRSNGIKRQQHMDG
jgi:hypothetical protein